MGNLKIHVLPCHFYSYWLIWDAWKAGIKAPAFLLCASHFLWLDLVLSSGIISVSVLRRIVCALLTLFHEFSLQDLIGHKIFIAFLLESWSYFVDQTELSVRVKTWAKKSWHALGICPLVRSFQWIKSQMRFTTFSLGRSTRSSLLLATTQDQSILMNWQLRLC